VVPCWNKIRPILGRSTDSGGSSLKFFKIIYFNTEPRLYWQWHRWLQLGLFDELKRLCSLISDSVNTPLDVLRRLPENRFRETFLNVSVCACEFYFQWYLCTRDRRIHLTRYAVDIWMLATKGLENNAAVDGTGSVMSANWSSEWLRCCMVCGRLSFMKLSANEWHKRVRACPCLY